MIFGFLARLVIHALCCSGTLRTADGHRAKARRWKTRRMILGQERRLVNGLRKAKGTIERELLIRQARVSTQSVLSVQIHVQTIANLEKSISEYQPAVTI